MNDQAHDVAPGVRFVVLPDAPLQAGQDYAMVAIAPEAYGASAALRLASAPMATGDGPKADRSIQRRKHAQRTREPLGVMMGAFAFDLSGVFAALVGDAKKRSAFVWFFAALTFGHITLLAIAGMPEVTPTIPKQTHRQECEREPSRKELRQDILLGEE